MRRHTLKKRSAKSGGGRPTFRFTLAKPAGHKSRKAIQSKVTTVGPSGHPVALNALRLRNQGFHHPTIINTRRRNAMLANAATGILRKNATVTHGSLRRPAFRHPTFRNNRSHLFAGTTRTP